MRTTLDVGASGILEALWGTSYLREKDKNDKQSSSIANRADPRCDESLPRRSLNQSR
jgi:hypothetical protein